MDAGRLVWVWAAVILIILAGLGVAATLPARQEPEAPKVRTSPAMDQNRNKIFDSLEVQMTAGDPGQKLSVIVLTEQPVSDILVERSLGEAIAMRHVYQVIPGFAAALTRDQIQQLSTQDWVRQIEPDVEVQGWMDSASHHFGASAARLDFGVDGDGDGQPGVYSPADVVIAVIDTGIDGRHVDLAGKVIGWKDFVNNRADPYDDNGHGTHVAGIAAGAGVADPALRGVAPGAALVGLKVLSGAGSGSLSDVAAAVDWAVTNRERYGIKIISMSLGTAGSSDGTDSVSLAVNAAVDAGIVAVVAAGNSGPNRYTIGSPGAAEKAITMAGP